MPEISATNKGKYIGKVMQMGVDTVNGQLDVGAIFRKEAEGEDRTVQFRIYEDGNEFTSLLYQQGYHVVDGKIVPVELQGYTVTYKLGESTWISLITQRRTFRQLLWYGEMEAEGDYILRDIMIWSKFFESYAEKVSIPFYARTVLRPQKGVV